MIFFCKIMQNPYLITSTLFTNLLVGGTIIKIARNTLHVRMILIKYTPFLAVDLI